MALYSMIAARALKKATSLVLLIAIFSLMLTGHTRASGAHIDISLPTDIPAALNNFASGNGDFSTSLVGLFLGVGHQVYTFNGTAWINSNVSADLYDKHADVVAHHFFLPPPGIGGGMATWAQFSPPSFVTAVPVVKVPQTDAVPLLLLNSTAARGPPSPSGTFGEVTHVQRLQTHGGLPPSTTSTTIGTVFFSPYSAVYAFYHVA
ncbi:unnamed protein product [Calypogeia fissa]